jgi:nucleoside-diphosphate-sugar epimerase
MPKILLTGATGRFGSFMLPMLQKRGEIVAIVRKKDSQSDQSALMQPGIEIVECDLARQALPQSVFNGVSKIVHLAGLVGDHPYGELLHANSYSAKNLLLNCPTSVERIVMASSISVYGEYKGQLVDESFTPKGESPYGKSKLLGEQFAREFVPRLPITFLRFGMIYGPLFTEGYFEVFSRLKGGKMKILGDGTNRLPLVNISDVAQAILLELDAKTKSGREYNIVGPEAFTQMELLSLAASSLGVPMPTSHVPVLLAKSAVGVQTALSKIGITRKPSFSAENIRQMSLDRAYSFARAQSELGYTPHTKLADGVSQMVAIYKGSAKQP